LGVAVTGTEANFLPGCARESSARNCQQDGRTERGRIMKKGKSTKPPSDEYARFEQLARQVIAVPKKELDKRQAEYERERKKDPQKKKVA